MSIREMIGADVESGGLFDPLGEREREKYVKDDVCNETANRNVISGCASLGIQKLAS